MTPPVSRGDDACPDVDALVADHLPMARFTVNAVAARLQLPGHVDREELVACAQVALWEAARRFDPANGASFATFVRPRLQGAVIDELRASDWATRSVRANARRLEAVTEALAAELGATPSRAQVADRLGVTVREVDVLHHDIARAMVDSIDAEHEAGTVVPCPTGTPEATVLQYEREGYLVAAIDALPDRLGEVIERNFFRDEPLTQVADDLGVSLSRASQMRAHGLRLLKAALGEVVDGHRAEEAPGGVRARTQQRRYVAQVAATRSPLAAAPRPPLSPRSRVGPVLAAC